MSGGVGEQQSRLVCTNLTFAYVCEGGSEGVEGGTGSELGTGSNSRGKRL